MSRTIISVPKLVINQDVSAPIIYTFKDNNKVEGRLEVYKRSITWYPKNSKKGLTLRIDELDYIFEEYGRKRRTRK